ncbi:MAG TPA: hypothetical protein PLW86_16230 [Rhodocyclaceae bacterium]|nr:hypothetical protein [Rhodocyclaceae bacterium]
MLKWTRRFFIPAALVFLAYSAWVTRDSLLPTLATTSIPHLLLACLLWCLAQWVGPLGTLAMARILGIPLGYRELSLVSVLRLPAKYLPGGIWQSVARFAAYRKMEIRNSDSMTILIAEHVFALGVSIALGSSLLLVFTPAPTVTLLAVGLLVVGLVLLLCSAVWLLRKRISQARTLRWVFGLAFSTALFWVLASASFCIYWVGVFGFSGTDIPLLASSYLLSWAVGFIAIFAPQGLGIFEWVAAHLVPSTQPLSVVVTAVAGFRLVAIAGDLTAWIIGLGVSRCSAGRAPHRP